MALIFSAPSIQFNYSSDPQDSFLHLQDLRIHTADRVLLVGQSGSGKTTLLRIIEGSLQPQKSIIEKRGKAALIYQDFRLIADRSVLQNVLSGALGDLKPFQIQFSDSQITRATDLVRELGLEAFLYQKVAHLSGGQKQRVAIARALMREPEILLADECFNQLDKKTAESIFELISTLQETYGFAFVLSQHDGKIPETFFNKKIALPTKTSTPTKSGHGFWLYAGALVFLGVFSSLSISLQGVSTTNFFSLALKTFGSFVPSSWNNILQMNWLELAQVMLETFGMAFWGTLVGTIASIPLAVLCSNNLFPTFVFRPLRLVITFIRTVPSVIWGLVFVAAAGLGAISGIAALALYTTGYLTKLIYEGLEDLDRMSFLALRQLGASRFQAFWYAVKPDSYSVIISNSLFMLEYNFRGASLLGLVGAGGIGQTLMYYIEWRQFEKAGVIISLMFICVLILDSLSEKLRKFLNSHKIS